jgi:hypothetical protein
MASLDGDTRVRTAAATTADASIDRFLNGREAPLVNAIVRRHMVATTRGGSMTAWLDACTYVDGAEMRYRVVGEGGSGSIRKRALYAALDGEVKARRQGDTGRAALDRANYEFVPDAGDAAELRVRIRPRRKDAMLIDGTMVLDGGTGDLLRVEGRLVKAPSFWTRQVDVVRTYARVASVRVPTELRSKAQVLVMGASTLDMSYRYLSVNGVPAPGAAAADPARECDAPSAPSGDPLAAARHHEEGVAFHARRSLDEASDEYEATLRLDPPRATTSAQRQLVERLAPRVFTTRSEPFALRDFAAVVHPDVPLIAYHFFWDDDIDYPDDNEPSDHEVVWVRYRPDGTLDRFWTYFHGRVLDGGAAALADARAHGNRPAVFVQWGKHGSMPIGWREQMIEAEATETEAEFYPVGVPITLERYNRGTFDKLATKGARAADHPLARVAGWPRTFTGSWNDFSRFDRAVDAAALLRSRKLVLVSRWNSATINQRFLRYNFKPKTEWPIALP